MPLLDGQKIGLVDEEEVLPLPLAGPLLAFRPLDVKDIALQVIAAKS